MVGGAITDPTATPEPDMRLSPHPAYHSARRDDMPGLLGNGQVYRDGKLPFVLYFL